MKIERLLPWKRIERDVQRMQERMDKRLDLNEQSFSHEIERQRAQIDAQITRQDYSFSNVVKQIEKVEQQITGLARQITNTVATQRPKRLFISTGFFATTLAATIVRQQNRRFDDYLLVTIDRQTEDGNRQWAYQTHDDWIDVQTVDHVQYYERTDTSPPLPFDGMEFDEVFSPFIEMAEFVRQAFLAHRYHFYEEGLTSYLQAMRFTPPDTSSRFFALTPTVVQNANVSASPIDLTVYEHVLRRSAQCYRIPRFDGRLNIIIVVSGAPREEWKQSLALLDPYNELVESLLSSGYTVWVKEHPRVPLKDVFCGSKLAQLGARLLETNAPLLETVIACNKDSIAAIVSVYSSILVSAFTLFNIPAFSLRAQVAYVGQAWWKNIQDAAVPDAADLAKSAPEDVKRVVRDWHNSNLGWKPPV